MCRTGAIPYGKRLSVKLLVNTVAQIEGDRGIAKRVYRGMGPILARELSQDKVFTNHVADGPASY